MARLRAYLMYLALHLVLPYLAAFLLSWMVGIISSFFLNCRFTYRVPPTWRRFAAYPLSVLPNIALSTIGVVVMVESWGWSERLAPLVATTAALPLSYLLARAAVLRRRSRARVVGRTRSHVSRVHGA